jgi:hypothetical protein
MIADIAGVCRGLAGGEATAYERELIRICDALIQYERGKWASTPQERIPARIVAAALASYDPEQPLKFSQARPPGPAVVVVPVCPACVCKARPFGVHRGRKVRKWLCDGCGRLIPEQEAAC